MQNKSLSGAGEGGGKQARKLYEVKNNFNYLHKTATVVFLLEEPGPEPGPAPLSWAGRGWPAAHGNNQKDGKKNQTNSKPALRNKKPPRSAAGHQALPSGQRSHRETAPPRSTRGSAQRTHGETRRVLTSG